MPTTPFELAGALLATGSGILFLAALAASIVLIWEWRWALVGSALLLLGVSSVTATLHGVPALITANQWLSVVVGILLLGLSARFHSTGIVTRANANWLLRALALSFLLGAWWVVDPGVRAPLFSQVETDLLIWVALCGILLLSLTTSPFFMGIGFLLLLAPLQSIAPVLMPGAGLSIFVGIAQILIALACAYLTLMQSAHVTNQYRVVTPLIAPVAAQPSAAPTQTTQPSLRPVFRRPALVSARTAPANTAPSEPQPETQTSVEERA
ncbi:MAG: hypothetical protein ACK47M_14845 [Caldilinea sp.]